MPTRSASARLRTSVAKAASISRLSLACTTSIRHPDGRGRCRHVPRHGLGIGSICRIDESGNTSCSRHQFTQHSKSLGTQTKFSDIKIDAGRVAARPGEAGDETEFDRIVGDAEHDWNVAVAAFAASAAGVGVATMTAT